MKLKLILWLLAAAAGMGVLGVAMDWGRSRSTASPRGAHQLLLPSLAANQVETIRITDNGGTLEIMRKNDGWCLPPRSGYPADFEMVQGLLLTAVYMKAVQIVDARESQYGRMKLRAPGKGGEDAGTDIKLFSINDRLLAHFVLGKEYTAPTVQEGGDPDARAVVGRFVLVPESALVALTNMNPGPVPAAPESWLKSGLIPAMEPASVILEEDGAAVWTLTRAAPGAELVLADLKPDEETLPDRLIGAGNPLMWERFADVCGKLDPAAATPRRILRIRGFSGIEYALSLTHPAPREKYGRASVSASFTPAPRVPPKSETPDEARKGESLYAKRLESYRARVEEMNRRTNGWVYYLDRKVFDSVPLERKAFLKGA